MYCPNCGAIQENDVRFCSECGALISEPQGFTSDIRQVEPWQSPNNVNNGFSETPYNFLQQPPIMPVYTGVPIKNYDPDLDYNPIGMWGYFFCTILLNIPIIGWIFMILFSAGITKNVNLRNYARAWLCGYAVALIFAVLTWWPYIKNLFSAWMALR